ncbi:MAG: hypothetical protein ACOY3I_04475 [Verrucomicrobiota bacterium]
MSSESKNKSSNSGHFLNLITTAAETILREVAKDSLLVVPLKFLGVYGVARATYELGEQAKRGAVDLYREVQEELGPEIMRRREEREKRRKARRQRIKEQHSQNTKDEHPKKKEVVQEK